MTAVEAPPTPLSIPEGIAEMGTHEAALAYARAGWYVGPLRAGTKNPGSLLGNRWPLLTSRDTKQITDWFAGAMADVGLFLHVGRSGAIVFDVDDPGELPEILRDLPNTEAVPFQSTRTDVPGRGHYPFLQPAGRVLGNSRGELGRTWGEMRGANGVIVVAPTPHPDGGSYEWLRSGDVPVLPPALAAQLPDCSPAEEAATDARVEAFLAEHSAGNRTEMVGAIVARFKDEVRAGQSRHEQMVAAACWAAREAQAGLYPARTAHDTLQGVFADAMASPDGDRHLDRGAALTEFAGIFAWAVGQADSLNVAQLDQLRAQVADRMPDRVTAADAKDDVEEGDAPEAERPETGPVVLPDEFWARRPVLEHIRRAAYSRARSADLVLLGVLARLSAYVSHTYELPPIVGSPSPLNLFVLAVGPSGSGKSSGSRLADELLTRPDGVDDRPLGSGEGIAESYMGSRTEPDENGKKRTIRCQVRHNVFIYGDEGAALVEMMDRKGATLGEALRRAWGGETLGQANASDDRTRVVKAGQYSLGVLIGIQPGLAGRLLGDEIAGTPQRFLFASATDPAIPDASDMPKWPGPLGATVAAAVTKNHVKHRGGFVRHQLGVDPEIALELKIEAVQRARGTLLVDDLDAHRPLQLLKVAGLLAVLDGRLDIELDDWDLAKMIWSTSCRVRDGVVATLRHHEDRAEAKRLERHANREKAGEVARGSARSDVERHARNLAGWVHDVVDPDEGVTWSDLRKRLNSRNRHLAEAAVGVAQDQGWVTEADGRYFPSGSRPS